MYEQVFLKEGGESRRTPWHQDSSYLPIDGSQIAVMWIDSVAKNDSLEFVRGSHHGTMYDGSRFDPNDDTAPIYGDGSLPRLPNIEAERSRWDIVSWAVEPGDVIVFHPGVLHGGAATHRGTRRRTLSLRFFGVDARYAGPTYQQAIGRSRRPAASVFARAAALSPGDPLRHPGFPKLRPAATPQRICISAAGKYCIAGESEAIDVQRQVARALVLVERNPAQWEPVFLDAQIRGVVMGGRINSSAGTPRESTWINCFVQPVADAISHSDEDGRPGIYVALQEATETMRRGGGVGYDFSRLRPHGAYVATTQSEASGPVSYMRVFDRSCETVESAGARRGAQMGILRIDHPDVLEFVHAKGERGELVNFNMSVAVTDDFMQWLLVDGEFELVHKVPPSPRLTTRGLSARRRNVGVQTRARAGAMGRNHALHVRPRRARHSVHRPRQRRQQPLLLRAHRSDESVRRTAIAFVRLLLSRQHRPYSLRRSGVHAGGAVRFRRICDPRRECRTHARQRTRRNAVAIAETAG
jgi:hypothetical protein